MEPLTDYNSALPAAAGHRAVALDATGSRAMVPAFVLQELERRTALPVSRLFDILVGSSTGGLMALLLACPEANGSPRYAALDLDEKLHRELASIVSPSAPSRVVRAVRLTHSGRQSEALDSWLLERFGDTPLSAAAVRVVVCVYDMGARRVRFFDSLAAREDPHQDLPMATAAHATLATPPFVAPVHVPDPQLRRTDTLVDGALFGANPTLVALAALEHGIEDQPLLLALGGGSRRDPVDEQSWRDPKLAFPLLDAARSGLADLVAAVAERSLGMGGYVRLEPELDWREHSPDDEEGPRSFGLMRDIAWRLVSEHDSDLNALSAHLASRRSYAGH
ncbi:MAG: patatin-like phospholipase family protein [Solirubrobacteraceae bacterium]